MRTDKLGWVFAVALVVIAAGATFVAVERGWFRSFWELGAWLLAVAAFTGVGVGVQRNRMQGNADAYGSAKAATVEEAQAAARGETRAASLNDRSFPN